MLPQPAIVAALQTHWRDNLPLDILTIYPGAQADTRSVDAWCELWIDQWSQPPRRHEHPDVATIAVTVHLFTRASATPGRIHELVDAARAALEHQTIAVHDRSQSSEPLIGHLTLDEPQLRNLTRALQPLAGDRLQHIVLTLLGRAQSLPTV